MKITNLSLNLLSAASVQDMLQDYLTETELEYRCDCEVNTSRQKYHFVTLPGPPASSPSQLLAQLGLHPRLTSLSNKLISFKDCRRQGQFTNIQLDRRARRKQDQ
ncbi:hypothetical protein Q8A73_005888 [Channa argus]|nr:hypothetical protein Q8A73_005888 [Channa argus]